MSIYSEEHKNIIKRLKKARFESGLDQADVAKKLGKSQSYISKIELGQRRIEIIVLKQFARIYNKSLDYFLK